jgi:hypothetical protein
VTDPIDREWHAAVAATPPCLCGHGSSLHGTSGRCASAACGCIRLRPREKATAPLPAAAAPVRRGLPELVVCPAGCHKGQVYEDPDLRGVWCPRCAGVGVVEDEQ